MTEYVATIYMSREQRARLSRDLQAFLHSGMCFYRAELKELIEAIRDAPTQSDIAYTDLMNRELNDGY